jgi:hypothetical protein
MPAEEVDARHKGLRSGRLAVIVIVVVACAALCAIAWGASRQWPLAQARVLQDLREASDSEVIVRAFHERYFPTPGCIMEGVVVNVRTRGKECCRVFSGMSAVKHKRFYEKVIKVKADVAALLCLIV